MKRLQILCLVVCLAAGAIGLAWNTSAIIFKDIQTDSSPGVAACTADGEVRIPRLYGRHKQGALMGYLGYPIHAEESGEFPELTLLLAGTEAFQAGNSSQALAIWRSIIAEFHDTPARNMAVLNSGRVLRHSGRHSEAIAVLKALLADEVNYAKLDRPQGADSFLAFNNDWHDACVLVSESYEALGDLPSTLKYARLSLAKFRPRHMCGNVGVSVESSLRHRIASLESRLEIGSE